MVFKEQDLRKYAIRVKNFFYKM